MDNFIDVLELSLGIPIIQGFLLLSTCILVYGFTKVVSTRIDGGSGDCHLSRLGIYFVGFWCILSFAVFLLLQSVELDDIGTVYAPGYDNSKFDKIELGDSRRFVEELLGLPLETTLEPYSCWNYEGNDKELSCYFFYGVVMVVDNLNKTVKHIRGNDLKALVRASFGVPDEVVTKEITGLYYSLEDPKFQATNVSSFQMRWIYCDNMNNIVIHILSKTSVDFL